MPHEDPAIAVCPEAAAESPAVTPPAVSPALQAMLEALVREAVDARFAQHLQRQRQGAV